MTRQKNNTGPWLPEDGQCSTTLNFPSRAVVALSVCLLLSTLYKTGHFPELAVAGARPQHLTLH